MVSTWLCVAASLQGATLFVDAGATGNNTGTNWVDAFTSLTLGLGFLNDDDTLWVAQGKYVPGGSRASTFAIPRRVDVYGGFTNGMETLGERDWKRYPTILSGDPLGNDGPNWSNRDDNAYHVVHSEGDPFSFKMRLDGFIIRGGNANGLTVSDDDFGGGAFIQDSDQIVIANCVFADNEGGGSGGIHLKRCEDAEIIDCVFSGNRSTNSASDYGSGAIGGAAQNVGFPGTVRRSAFTGNASAARGGVTYDTASDWELGFENCVFAGNSAGSLGGGALYLRNGSNRIVNCTFTGNDPEAILAQGDTPEARNCILWEDVAEVGTSGGGSLNAFFCDIDQVGFAGVNNNIHEDPIWAVDMGGSWTAGGSFDTAIGVTMLSDSGAGWPPNALAGLVVNPDTNQVLHFYVCSNTATRVWVFGDASTVAASSDAYRIRYLQLGDGSPCIETATDDGAPADDIRNTLRPIGARFDMGAYESSVTGSVSGVIYADDTATGLNDGTSWLHAYTNLQDALGQAQVLRDADSDDLTIQVWVAAGTYFPGSARTDSFVLVHRVPVYGGFAGIESDIAQRSIKSNPTILSGDLNGDDAAGWTNRSDNAYHVIADTNFTKQVRLDGFVIRGGNADGQGPTLRLGQGGGLFSEDSQDLTIQNCVFTDNSAGGGGGMLVRRPNGGQVHILDCSFSGNRATEAGNSVGGGGLAGFGNGDGADGTLTVERCIFAGNAAPDSIGGGAHLSSLGTALEGTFVNCLVVGNASGYVDGDTQGGGLDLRGTNATLQNCTIVCNDPVGFTSKDNILVGWNLIVWSNVVSAFLDLGEAPDVTSSIITGDGFSGFDGNIEQDPAWVYDMGATWTLAGSYDASKGLTVLTDGNAAWLAGEHAGRIVNPDAAQVLKYIVCTNDSTTLTVWGDATTGGGGDSYRIHDFQLTSSSPAIDAGAAASAPADDLLEVTRPLGLEVDMGAFEFSGPIPFSNGVIYVDIDATGADDGTSWTGAFTNLQDAIFAAPGTREIWVAEGTYYPGDSISDSFVLKPNVPVYGGFKGSETQLTQRNWRRYCTLLCGDLQMDDAADHLLTIPHASRADNARHVVRAQDLTTLDGVVVAGGYAYHASDIHPDSFGGGVLVDGTAPEIRNCTFVDNFARGGGALGVLSTGAPIVQDCTFSGNWGINGGALFSQGSPWLNRCTFAGTETRDSGGAMYFEGASNPRVQNSIISGNSSTFDGAIRISGGAGASNELELVNCTLTDNVGFWNGAIYINRLSQPVIWNTILWNNQATGVVSKVEIGIDAAAPQGAVDINYSDITGGFAGTSNIDANPIFIPAPTGTWLSVSSYDPGKRQTTFSVTGGTWLATHHLAGYAVNPDTNQWKQFTIAHHSSTSLTVWGNAELVASPGDSFSIKNYELLFGSPCINAGTAADAPDHDIRNLSRPRGVGFEMGAFEIAPLPKPEMIFMIH
jgi:hypothetical protein